MYTVFVRALYVQLHWSHDQTEHKSQWEFKFSLSFGCKLSRALLPTLYMYLSHQFGTWFKNLMRAQRQIGLGPPPTTTANQKRI